MSVKRAFYRRLLAAVEWLQSLDWGYEDSTAGNIEKAKNDAMAENLKSSIREKL